jgi:hypothetical protein
MTWKIRRVAIMWPYIRHFQVHVRTAKYRYRGLKLVITEVIFFNLNTGGLSPTGYTRHVGHQLAYCTCPGWLWWWRNWWNDHWQGKAKCSEKTYPNTTLSTTNLTWSDRAWTRAAAVGSQRLNAWATARRITEVNDDVPPIYTYWDELGPKWILYLIFIHSFSSMALQPFVGPWPLLQFRNLFYIDGRTPSTSDQPVARPLPTHRTTQT